MITTAAGVLAEAVNDFKSSAAVLRVVGRRAGLVNRLNRPGFYDCFERDLKKALFFRKKKRQTGLHDFGGGAGFTAAGQPHTRFLCAFFQKSNRLLPPGFAAPPVAGDQRIAGRAVGQGWFHIVARFGDDVARQRLAERDAPLVETVDVPDGALGEHAVFVEQPSGCPGFSGPARQPKSYWSGGCPASAGTSPARPARLRLAAPARSGRGPRPRPARANWPPVQPFGARRMIIGLRGRTGLPLWICYISYATRSSTAAMRWCISTRSSPSTK